MNGPLPGGGARTCLAPERAPFIHEIGTFHSQNWNVPILLLLDNHIQLQRPLAEKNKKKIKRAELQETKKNLNKNRKMKIHNTMSNYKSVKI